MLAFWLSSASFLLLIGRIAHYTPSKKARNLLDKSLKIKQKSNERIGIMNAIDIKRLIPQREPMLMIDRMVEACGDNATTSFTIRSGNIFLSADGEIDEVALIENMAQSASALAGLKALSEGATEPPVGYIGEVKNFVCLGRPRTGDELLTHIEMGATVGGVTIVNATVEVNNQTFASTQLKIFIPDADANRPITITFAPIAEDYPKTVADLSNSYFDINSSRVDGNQASFGLTLRRNCTVYQGHFPCNPVCPGVCNILMLKQCALKVIGKELHLTAIKQCRLTAVATPISQSALNAEINLTPNTNGAAITATLSDELQTYMKLKGELN